MSEKLHSIFLLILLTATAKSEAANACPPGFDDLWMEGDSCFRVEMKVATVQEAGDGCLELGGQLASIHSEEEQEAVGSSIAQQDIDFAWIGLIYDGNEWKWMDSSPVDYTQWGTDQPLLDVNDSACIQMFNYQWFNDYCQHQHPFVCKIPKLVPHTTIPAEMSCPAGYEDLWMEGNSCYQIITGHRKSFPNANDTCFEKGGYLVIIHSAEEDQAIKDHLRLSNKHKEYWIGLKTDDGLTWNWVDGSPMDYAGGWFEDEPSGSSKYKCASISFFEDGSWVNMECEDAMEFICEAPRLHSNQ